MSRSLSVSGKCSKAFCTSWLYFLDQPLLGFHLECFLPHTSYSVPEREASIWTWVAPTCCVWRCRSSAQSRESLLPGSFGLTDVTALTEPYLSSIYLCSGNHKGGPVGSLSALATNNLWCSLPRFWTFSLRHLWPGGMWHFGSYKPLISQMLQTNDHGGLDTETMFCLFVFVFCCCLFVWNRASLPYCPGTHYVDQAFNYLPAPAGLNISHLAIFFFDEIFSPVKRWCQKTSLLDFKNWRI